MFFDSVFEPNCKELTIRELDEKVFLNCLILPLGYNFASSM